MSAAKTWEIDKPKVYTTPQGVRYVKPEDIMRSRKGQEGIRATTELFKRLQDKEGA